MSIQNTGRLFDIIVPVREFRIRLGPPSTETEPSDRLTFWWSVTSSALALSQSLCAMGSLSGQRVLELGCGPGLGGITAGLLGAEVTFSDYLPQALGLAESNARLNRLDRRQANFRILDWDNPGELESFDLIIGSEILYDYFFHGSLISLFKRAARDSGRVVLADRKRLAVERFVGRLKQHGFVSREENVHIRTAGFPEQEISVFTFARPGKPAR